MVIYVSPSWEAMSDCFTFVFQRIRKDLLEGPVQVGLDTQLYVWVQNFAKMDFQHRAGGKTGSGGVASSSESNRDRRERLRQLALETIDINKDPYFMKNHLGSYECKLCLTLHNNEVRGHTMELNYLNVAIFWMFWKWQITLFITGKLLGAHTRQETSDQLVSPHLVFPLTNEKCFVSQAWFSCLFLCCVYFNTSLAHDWETKVNVSWIMEKKTLCLIQSATSSQRGERSSCSAGSSQSQSWGQEICQNRSTRIQR